MKILKILGVVIGSHALAFILVFSIPGCSSTTKTAEAAPAAPAVASTPTSTPPADPPPAAAAPIVPVASSTSDASGSAPLVPTIGGGAFYPPTRPNSMEATQLQPAEVPADVTPAATYTVKSGDSLWIIAHRNHLKVSELASANHLRSSSPLHLGQKLIIPGKRAEEKAAPAGGASLPMADLAAAPASKAAAATKYTVKAGDRLGSIARRFGLTTGDLAAANNITDPARIRPGQELVIPAGGHARGSHKSHTASHPAEAQTPAPVTANLEPAAAPQIEPVAPSAAAPSASPSIPIIKIGGDSSAPSSDGSSAPSSQ